MYISYMSTPWALAVFIHKHFELLFSMKKFLRCNANRVVTISQKFYMCLTSRWNQTQNPLYVMCRCCSLILPIPDLKKQNKQQQCNSSVNGVPMPWVLNFINVAPLAGSTVTGLNIKYWA